MKIRRAVLFLFVLLFLIPSSSFGFVERPLERMMERTHPGDPDFPDGYVINPCVPGEEESAATVNLDMLHALKKFLLQFTGGL